MAPAVRAFLLALLAAPSAVMPFQSLAVRRSSSSVSYFGAPSTGGQISSSFSGARTRFSTSKQHRSPSPRQSNSQLNMFMGSDGGILGIGTPEIATILLVGYFVLGPSDLYKLTKEIGKFIQNFRTFSAEATQSFESTMESQLQLDEIRKAQRELNDAFSFRRSINVDQDSEAFEVNAKSPRAETPIPESVVAAVAAKEGTEVDSGKPKKKRRVRRRVKKQEELPEVTPATVAADGNMLKDIPDDLVMPNMEKQERSMASVEAASDSVKAEQMGPTMGDSAMSALEQAQAELLAEMEEKNPAVAATAVDPAVDAAAQSRFQSQMSGSWNDQVMAKTEELTPLASIMERLAILEEEKNAADSRLQDEFRQREELAERFYREKRQLLEDAATQVQMEAYGDSMAAPAQTEVNNTSAKGQETKV